MRVFITGGTGLLGSNVIPVLLQRGHEVLALVRAAKTGPKRLPERVTLVHGDLTRPESYGGSLSGADAVIHAAACYGEFYRESRSETALRAANVDGTLGLLQASHRNGVRRVVYVSSAGVLETRTGAPTDETAPYAAKSDGDYFQSKIDAERAAIRFAGQHSELELVVLLPAVMLGPGDAGPTPVGALLLQLLEGRMKIILPGFMNVVDARDVAAAAVAALERGADGKRYLIGGKRYSIREIFTTMARVSGRAAPTRTPPALLLRLVLGVRRAVARLRGVRSPPADINRLLRDFWFSSAAAEHDLGLSYRPLEETLADTARWFLRKANARSL